MADRLSIPQREQWRTTTVCDEGEEVEIAIDERFYGVCQQFSVFVKQSAAAVLASGGSIPVRKIRYAVAMSLDGHIAGPNEEYDWIGMDAEVDFTAFWSQFDTLLMGRRTFELAVRARGEAAFTAFTGVTSIVFSRTLKQQEHPSVTVMPELKPDCVRELKAQSGKDIWLFGGSNLFRSFLDSGLVDGVEVAVLPVLLGAGIPLLPPPYSPTKLRLISHHVYRSGRVSLAYEVAH